MAHENSPKDAYVSRVLTVCELLIDFFHEHPLFQNATLEQYTEPTRRGIGIKLFLSDGTYANCYFSYDAEEDKREAHITDVESDIKQTTGFFLFHLQLIIAVMSGTSEITLENNTDNIPRARKGIYQLFKINDRTMDQEERNRMTPKRWDEKPEMYYLVHKSSLSDIQRVLEKRIGSTLESSNAIKVWRPDAMETIGLLFRRLNENAERSQGKRRKTVRKRGGGAKRLTKSKKIGRSKKTHRRAI